MDLFLLTACSAGLIVLLQPLLTANMLAGWDLVPHYQLLNQMTHLLQDGRLRGYDLAWNAGCPVFFFYGPLVYLLPAGLSLLPGVSVGAPFFLNALLCLQPLLTVWLLYGVARKFGGSVCARFSVAGAMCFLTTMIGPSHAGTGIAGLIYHGLINQMVGLNLLLAWLWVVAPDRREYMRSRSIIAAALLLAAIVASHMMTAFFAFFAIAIFLVTSPHRAKFLALSTLLGLLLSGWFIFPYISMAELTGGIRISYFDPRYPDALLFLLPGLTPQTILAAIEAPSWATITALPWASIMILISVPAGILHCFETRQRALPGLYLAGLILLPRAFLTHIVDTPLHTYRFIPPLFLLQTLLAAIGLWQIWNHLNRFRHPRILKFAFLALTIAAALAGLAGTSAWLQSRDAGDLPRQASDPSGEIYHPFLPDYPHFRDAEALIHDLASQYDGGRVCVEVNADDMARLGSPHYFNTMLPLRHNIPTFPGLLAESSLSHGFVQAAMLPHSCMLSWAHCDLVMQPKFMSQSLESMLHRLGLYNIRYVLTTSEEYAADLEKLRLSTSPPPSTYRPAPSISVALLSRHGPYRLFKIEPARNLVEAINYRPFLFVDQGGKDFRFFAEQWYRRVDLFDRPVIFTHKMFEDLAADERESIGGLILSYPQGTQICAGDIGPWWTTAKPLIVLNAIPTADAAALKDVLWIPRFDEATGIEHVAEALLNVRPDPVGIVPISALRFENHRIEFSNHGGTLVNASYFPRWHATQGDRTLFWATPSLMWLWAQGDTRILFK